MAITPEVSVAIPALNEEKNIARLLSSLAAYFPKEISYEVVVGDHGSSDHTAAIAASKNACVHHFVGGTVGELRNRIVENCRGKIIVFLDADTSVTSEWGGAFRAVPNELLNDPNQIIGSMCRNPNVDNIFATCWFSHINNNRPGYLGTGHMILSALTFRRLGGFRPGLKTGEDFDFCARLREAGGKIISRTALKVFHHDYPTTIGTFFKREAWHGIGDAQSLRNVVHSKIAIASLIFIFLHIVILTGWIVNPWLSGVAAMSVLGGIVGCSTWKFKALPTRIRLCNTAIFYLYFCGRSWSLIQSIFRSK